MAERDEVQPVFLDSNVLMYAVGKDHPYREACREVLRRIETDDLRVVTNVEVLQELLHRYRSLGLQRRSITPVTEEDLDDAHEILRADTSISVRDAVHAATALRGGIKGVVSTDRHFDDLPGITRLDPIELVS